MDGLDGDSESKGHGGRREGAGRKPMGRKPRVSHDVRLPHDPLRPVHVTLRVVPSFPRLRDERTFEAIRSVLERYVEREFRVCQLSLQHNHIHTLKEADSHEAFTAGMRSFTMNAAKALNAVWGRAGRVFEDRYHSRQITDARDARNSLAYVLCNWRRHNEDFYDGESRAAALDRYSSAVTFEGWTERFFVPADYRPLPVSMPRTRLLAADWKRFGRIDPTERPGRLWYW